MAIDHPQYFGKPQNRAIQACSEYNMQVTGRLDSSQRFSNLSTKKACANMAQAPKRLAIAVQIKLHRMRPQINRLTLVDQLIINVRIDQIQREYIALEKKVVVFA